MKTVLASIISLALGLGLGWHFGHHRAEGEPAEAVQQIVEGSESSEGEHAARAIRAIQFIESGDPQQAVQLLAGPVASYYAVYGAGGANERRSKLRSLVEELARTNPVVAARLAAATTNAQLRTP